MKSQILKSTLIAAAGLLLANSALAATTDPVSFQVTATVADSCLVTALPLSFNPYDANEVSEMSSTITVACTAETEYEIGLNAGLQSAGATGTTRAMIGDDTATTLLNYELYTELAHTNVWGAPGETTVAQSALTGGPLVYTVYGQIPALQYVPAASYADTIAVTVTY